MTNNTMKPARGRISLREQIQRNQQALDIYRPAGVPRVVLNVPPEPKKRAAAVASGKALERDVQASVIELLRTHPKVAWFARLNSGVAVDTNAAGDARYTAFYRLYLRGEKPQSSGLGDILGQLLDSRLFLMECKREGVRKGSDAQEAVIAAVRAAGGVAGIVQSVDDAVKLLGAA